MIGAKSPRGCGRVYHGLQRAGFKVIAASNSLVGLLTRVSEAKGIHWDAVVDFVSAGIYKPNLGAYLEIARVAGASLEFRSIRTANPAFGDLEGADEVGMSSLVIRPS